MEGRRSRGGLDADDETAAIDQLLQRGLRPTSVKAEGVSRWGHRSPGLTRVERLSFVRDLANLISAGIALEPALGLVADQMDRPAASSLVSDLRQRVRAGENLGRALERYSKVFPQEFVGLVGAGEQSGSLPTALEHLAVLEADRAQFRQRLIGALIYPALIAFLTLAALALLTGYVLPQFQDLFAGSKAKLPTATLAVLAIGDLMGHYGPGLMAGMAIDVAGAVAVLSAGRRPPPDRSLPSHRDGAVRSPAARCPTDPLHPHARQFAGRGRAVGGGAGDRRRVYGEPGAGRCR
ncbi:type II secretion system F family protein [Azospirillum sp. B4]|uniref:type II secretion system F family protein n=1 Tax=Azospirillum sp. B4 TaxID=95605 RepID=UPI000348514D|nr:type II secretion system F family protein [Azospirillum sp. B4]